MSFGKKKIIDKIRLNLTPVYKKPMGCIVLTYHGLVKKITEHRLERNFQTFEIFKEQIKYLSKFRRFISVEALAQKLEDKESVSEYAVVTFDDGYRNNLFVPQLLNEIKPDIPFSIFLSTGYIGDTTQSIWTVNLSLLILKGYRETIEYETENLELTTEQHREVAFSKIRHHLKTLNAQDRNALYNDIVAQYKPDYIQELLEKYPQFKMLNWSECKSILSQDCSLGTHGIMHELQHDKQSPMFLRQENDGAKKMIFDKTGYETISMAYPNGDHCPVAIRSLADSGYKIAFTTQRGIIENGQNIFTLNRISLSSKREKYIYELSAVGR